MYDAIKIQVDGTDYSGWKSVTVQRSMEALTGRFTMTTVDRWALNAEAWTIYPGRFCRVLIGRDTILEGYVDSVNPSITKDSHEITVSGRDKTADLVDCGTAGRWTNLTLLRLAQSMVDPFGINVVSEVDPGPAFETFSAEIGETVFEALSRAARKRHVLLLTGRVGNLVITNTGNTSAGDRLVLGSRGNILSASGGYDYTDRFSRYTVKGQSRTVGSGWGATTISIKGEADDDEVIRYRPKYIKGQGIVTVKDAQNQARWEALIRAAKSFKATVEVSGFRQSTGDLWEVNLLADVDVPELLLAGPMLISAIEYRQNDQDGSITSMELTRPDAYVDEPPRTIKKVRNLGWMVR